MTNNTDTLRPTTHAGYDGPESVGWDYPTPIDCTTRP
jgi:hypothetical protein